MLHAPPPAGPSKKVIYDNGDIHCIGTGCLKY